MKLKRRDFLKLAGIIPVAAALPALPAPGTVPDITPTGESSLLSLVNTKSRDEYKWYNEQLVPFYINISGEDWRVVGSFEEEPHQWMATGADSWIPLRGYQLMNKAGLYRCGYFTTCGQGYWVWDKAR